MAQHRHLSLTEVETILEIVQEADAIVIGGQSLNLWAMHYRGKYPELMQYAPFTSKDIDFYTIGEAPKILADALDGELFVPDPFDNATPNFALVVAHLGDHKIDIDFMRVVLGVDSRSIQNNFVTLDITLENRTIKVLLLDPLDCLRSRLSNINVLARHDCQSVSQAHASLVVVRAYINELLDISTKLSIQRACSILHDLYYVTKTEAIGRAAYLRHGLDPSEIIKRFREDVRLDPRYRAKTVEPMLARIAAQYGRHP
jgi:hypothetical protein